jgi:aspartyl/glutamyl-tRNA(Asn/Gln) amidotransferase C subunit
MAIISQDEIINLIALAKLPLDKSILATRVKDMEEILGYVAKLSEINLKDVPPVPGGTDLINQLRPDVLDQSTEALVQTLRQAFPVLEAQMTKVPSILGK